MNQQKFDLIKKLAKAGLSIREIANIAEINTTSVRIARTIPDLPGYFEKVRAYGAIKKNKAQSEVPVIKLCQESDPEVVPDPPQLPAAYSVFQAVEVFEKIKLILENQTTILLEIRDNTERTRIR